MIGESRPAAGGAGRTQTGVEPVAIEQSFERDRRGEIIPLRADDRRARHPKSRDGLRGVLQALGFQWRYNTRAHRSELYHPYRNGGIWREANDRLVSDIGADIPLRFDEASARPTDRLPQPLTFGRVTWDDCFSALLHHAEIDPFMEWLVALPAWDGKARLDSWIETVFWLPESGELMAWTSRFLLLGVVWRTFRPGTKLDKMPVLIGPQGCGKSTVLRCLLPPECPEWFSDGLRLAADDKVRAEALQGRVIVEAAEMAGSVRAERESLKALLSRTDDGAVRLAYRRNPETMLRRCIIVGTSNDPHCLPLDPSGNRRFVVLTVRAGPDGAAGVRNYLAANRDQLWAEAVHRYHAGETAYLPEALSTAQAEANAAAISVNESLEDAVLSFLDGQQKPFRISDVRAFIKPIPEGETPSDRALAQELRRLDCEPLGLQSIDGRKGRFWKPPAVTGNG